MMAKKPKKVISEYQKVTPIPAQNIKRKKIAAHLSDRKTTGSLKNSAITKLFPAERTEEALREAERFLNSIFTSIQDGISILDKDMNIIRVNPTIEHWNPHAMPLVGKKCYEAYHGRKERCDICPTHETILTGKGAYEVVPNVGPNGKIVGWIDLYSFPLIDTATGKMNGVIEYVRDITKRKRTEEALRENEKRLQALMDASPIGISWADMQRNIKYTNRKFSQLFGYTVDDIPTIAEWRRLAYPDLAYRETVPSLVAMLTEAQKQGKEVRPIEMTITCKDGSTRYVEQIGAFASNQILAVFKDLTEHKLAEEALRESEKKYRTILEEMEEGYFETDLIGKLTLINDAGCRHLGYPREELIGMDNRMYADEENAKKVFQAFNKLYRTRQPCRVFDYELTRKDGTKIIVELLASLMRDSEGKPVGFRGISHDITERKRMEDDLRKSEETAKRLAQENEIVAEIGRIISSTLNIEEVYERFAEEVRRFIQFDRITINKINPKENTFVVLYSVGPYVADREVGKPGPLPGTATEWVMQNRSSLLILEANREEMMGRIPNLLPILEAGFRSIMLIPLISKDQVIGTLALQTSKQNAYTEADLALGERVCAQIAGALANAQLFVERKQAEEALRQSEERYRTILENVQEVYYEIDLAGNWIFLNEAFYKHLEYTKEEMIGKKSRQYQDETTARELYQAYTRLYETGEPIRAVEAVWISKDGSKRTYEMSASLITDPEGKPIGFRGVSRDVTERKRAEEALRQSEERYRTIIENIQDGYFEVDLAGNFTFVNDAESVIHGYSRDELIGMNFRQYTDEEYAKKVFQAFNNLYKTGVPIKGLDYEIIRKDGTKGIYEVSVFLIQDSEGKPIGFRGISRDVTERKRAEEALRKSEETAKRLAQENAAVAEIGRILSSTLNINEVYEQFGEEVRKVISFDRIAICIIDHEKDAFYNAYILGGDAPDRGIGNVVALAGSFTQEVLRSRSSQLIQTEGRNEVIDRFPGLLPHFQSGFRSFMAVPLISKDQVIGVLHLQSFKPNAYTKSDVRLSERVGNQIAGAIANAQLFVERKQAEEALRQSEETAKRLAQENAIMAEIGQIVSSTLKIEEVYERFAQEVRKVLPLDRVSVNTLNPDRASITIAYTFGVKIGDGEEGLHITMEIPVYENIINRRSSILIQTEDESELAGRYPNFVRHFRAGLRSMIATPLISKDQVVGILHIQSLKPNAYTESDVRLAEKVSSQIAGAIANAQLFAERKRAEEALRESEEKYRTVLENMAEGYFEVDLAGNFTFINDAECANLGYSSQELIGMNNRQYTDKETSKRAFAAFNRLYRTGDPLKRLEEEVIRKDGTRAIRELSATMIRDSAGKPVGFRVTSRDITERKRAEEALREAEKRYRQVVENAVDIIYTTDANGNFTYANPAALTTTGYSLEELQRFNYLDLILPEHRDRVSKILISQFREKQATTYVEFPFFNKSGDVIWFGQNASLVIEREKRVGFHVIARDITERKQAEEALRESEETAKRLAQENAIMAEIGRIVSATLNIEEIYEGFAEEVRKLIPFDRIVINSIDVENATVKNVYMAGKGIKDRIVGKIYPLEGSGNAEMVRTKSSLLIQTKDFSEYKERFPMLLSTFEAGFQSIMNVPLFSKGRIIGGLLLRSVKPYAYTDKDVRLAERVSNQIAGAIANAQLFSDQKQAEEALRSSEEKYRTIIENIQDGYFENDLAGNFTFVNDVICRNLRYTKEELIGMNYRQYTDEENAKKLYQLYSELYGTGQPLKPFEAGYVRRDGAKLIAEISVSLIKDSEGKPIGFRGISRDITERKQAEEEKMFLQEQLRQSQKMEAIGQLAGGVAHDFNNLLTVIKGYSQLSILDLKESDPLRGNIQEIEKATQRATDLTRQLLAFSRRQILDLKVVDLNDLLKDLEKMLRRIIGEDIELVTLLSEDLGKVKVDPSQIEQVIFNLAVNARDAMPSGGKLAIETANVKLDEEYARAHVSVAPGRYVRLTISDTGFGMTQEVKERVFEPFFTTKEKGKGTGLGLSMVYGIVKQSSGNIWVYSEPGRGTTFGIYLPRTEEEENNLHGREEADFSARGSETILLAEDEELVQDLATRLLEQQGYRVLKAANGQEALLVAKEHVGETIHLLLADIVMPQMGGKELADWLKISRPNVKVLYMSGYANNAIVHHGVLDPGTHFLQKPFSLKTLSHKVREVLDG